MAACMLVGVSLAALVSVVADARVDPARARWVHWRPEFGAIDSLRAAGRGALASARLDSLARRAERSPEAGLDGLVALARAQAALSGGRGDEAVAIAREWLPRFEARADTIGQCRALRFLAGGQALHGDLPGARTRIERGVGLARAARMPDERARLLASLANLELDAGRAGEGHAHALEAIAACPRTGQARLRLNLEATLARALQGLGRNAEARRAHARVLAEARRLGDLVNQAQTEHNLGTIDYYEGDLAAAVRHYHESGRFYAAVGATGFVLNTGLTLALINVNLSHYGEADSALTRLLPATERCEDPSLRARVYCQIGVTRRMLGRMHEATEFGERAIALADSVPAWTTVAITLPLVATYDAMGRREQSLALLDRRLGDPRHVLSESQRGTLATARAAELRALARPAEALPVLRAEAWRSRDVPPANLGADKLNQLNELAKCYRDLGQRDSALVWWQRIAQSWEHWRTSSTDPTFRERFDDFAARFAGQYALALLDPARTGDPATRAREGFDALQHFRARTLLERIADPDRDSTLTPRLVDAKAMQERVLGAGEVFVDVFPLPETTIVFVLTPVTIRAYTLRRGGDLFERMQRLFALVSAPGADGALATGASASIGAEVFGAGTDLIAPARRVILSAGTLDRTAVDRLTLPGETRPLSDTHEVTWAPSAAILADVRAARPTHAARTLLAIAQSSPWRGVALPGAKREAQRLAADYGSADALVDAAAPGARAFAARAARYDALHLAGHTRSGGQRPWQDAIRTGAGTGEDAWITAADIARLRVPASLCVLAGCRTIGRGERARGALEGLSAAWLAAGVPTVIATRWDVDDAATAELVRRFYRGLSLGRSAGEALRTAQLEMSRITRWSAPYYWAGLVLLGDPDTRLALAPRFQRVAVTGRR